MLHHWTISDEKFMKARLNIFREKLRTFEGKYNAGVDLLHQKLGHFGIE